MYKIFSFTFLCSFTFWFCIPLVLSFYFTSSLENFFSFFLYLSFRDFLSSLFCTCFFYVCVYSFSFSTYALDLPYFCIFFLWKSHSKFSPHFVKFISKYTDISHISPSDNTQQNMHFSGLDNCCTEHSFWGIHLAHWPHHAQRNSCSVAHQSSLLYFGCIFSRYVFQLML